ncbi:MAG: hypothetical protein COT81_03795 [Candidatus Buchananbacteria bacterium CG10_big_fil_rev_8_21_14_0_10_42_9]|uniref:Uncharacterized protein n=1 Tax=Candidatus Buchananbacteria bacterium CG10_big_fil_rev_8_21_14_0_10_42_9 TaxID=1974526 RepID=A0A2H0W0S7_9BACT|nr:MAG: hypothetical protein COT81_03795 [Candidatus Buchananbacteria bacterium CG10_big_fil_rev_8_21_14_0_10_42_9]
MSKRFKKLLVINKYAVDEQRGFTLIELLISIVIFSIGILGPIALINQSIKVQRGNREKIIATYLAAEGIELAKMQRDVAFFGNRHWDRYFNMCDGGDDIYGFTCVEQADCDEYGTPYNCVPISQGNGFGNDVCIQWNGNYNSFPPNREKRSLLDNFLSVTCSDRWRDGLGDPNPDDDNWRAICLGADGYYEHCPKDIANTPFERHLEIDRKNIGLSSEYILVTSKVSWNNGKQEVSLASSLYNWVEESLALDMFMTGYSFPHNKSVQVIDDQITEWGADGFIQGWEGNDNSASGKFPMYCYGGERDGEFCGDDYNCDDLNSVCAGGFNNGNACSNDSDCVNGIDDGFCDDDDGVCDYNPVRDENNSDPNLRDIDYTTSANAYFLMPGESAPYRVGGSGSLSFPGVDSDYVLLPEKIDEDAGDDLLDLTTEGSISLWIFNTRNDEAFFLGHEVTEADFGAGTADFEDNPYAFGYGFDSGVPGKDVCDTRRLSFVIGDGNDFEVHCGPQIPDWGTQTIFAQIGVTWDLNLPSNNVRFYINGQFVSDSTATIAPVHNVIGPQDRVLGKSGVEVNELPYWGRLSWVQIYRRALSDQEMYKIVTGE